MHLLVKQLTDKWQKELLMNVNYISSESISQSLSDIVETYIGETQDTNYIKFSNGVMIAYGSYNINTDMKDLNWKSPYTATIKYPVSFTRVPRIYVSNNNSCFVFAHDGLEYTTRELAMKTKTSDVGEMTIEYQPPLAYDILTRDGKQTSINYVEASFSWMAIGTWK